MSPTKSGAGVKYPYTLKDLILAKIIALVHDPPNKAPIVTGLAPGKSQIKDITRFLFKCCKNEMKYHEIYGYYILEKMICCSNILIEYFDFNFSNIFYKFKNFKNLVENADRIASSFDRIMGYNISYNIKYKYKNKKEVYSGYVYGLANMFNPRVHASSESSFDCRLYLKLFDLSRPNNYKSLINKFIINFENLLKKENIENICISEFYHLFSLLYEPLWHSVTRGVTWGPADTRVPTHSIFDHLYATAGAVNFSMKSGKYRGKYRGVMVYVEWPGIGEWLRGSRKLSDLWVASWLISAMVWYTVKELVWCLGPDVLVTPSFRWNQFYISLLREKMPHVFENNEELDRFLRKYYMWEGFPYYAWMPGKVVLFLPMALKPEDDPNCSGCSGIIARLYSNKYNNIDYFELEGYLRERFREAWRKVVGAVKEWLVGRRGGRVVRRMLASLELVEDEPPVEPVISIVSFRYEESRWREVRWYSGGEEIGSDNLKVDGGINSYNIIYSRAFFRLLQAAERAKQRPIPVGTARLLLGHARERLRSLAEVAGEGSWRSCSVCRTGVATVRIPGRDTPGGVSEEFVEFSLEMEPRGESVSHDVAWRKWRPVFRPGERLCPYCLVKRLAGLSEVFEVVGEKLIGYKPDKEVRFPSTDDVAALSIKVALAVLARILIAGGQGEDGFKKEVLDEARKILQAREGEIVDLYKKLARELSRTGEASRSRLYKSLADSCQDGSCSLCKAKKYFRGKWWTPTLLYLALEKLMRAVVNVSGREDPCENDENEGSEGRVDQVGKVPLVGASLLLAGYEFRDLLEQAPKVAEKLIGIARAVSEALRESRDSSGDEARRAARLLLRDIVEALARPRLYYSIVKFDVDGLGRVVSGLLPARPERGAEPLSPKEYSLRIVQAIHENLEGPLRGALSSRRRYKDIHRFRRSLDFMKRVIEALPNSNISNVDKLFVEAERYGSVLVSPSYHYAVFHSVSLMNYIVERWSVKLGGIPVYMGGDEGLIILPSWLPSSVLFAVTHAPVNAVRRLLKPYGGHWSLGLGVRDQWRLAYNPGVLLGGALGRLLWSSDGRYPGFYNVANRYHVPALVSNTVSVGVRFPHYRDHLYSEIAAVWELVEHAKALGGGRMAVSMGRMRPTMPGEVVEAAATVRLQEPHDDPYEALSRAGRSAGAILMLLGAAAVEGLSVSAFYGLRNLLPGGMEALNSLAEESGRDFARLLRLYLERHLDTRRAGRLGKPLLEIMKSIASEDPREALNILEAARMSLAAMKRQGWGPEG